MEAEALRRAAELIIEARGHRSIEVSCPSDILTIVANALCAAAEEFNGDEEEAPENVPCEKCGRTDLPLHVNRQCPECYTPSPNE